MNPFQYDFGYAWQYSWVHLVPIVVGIVAMGFAIRFRRSRALVVIGAILTIWGVFGLLVLQFGVRINLPLQIPTDRFVASDRGDVLDVGAGSGRAAIAVLLERPQTKVVALDWFRPGYGIEQNTQARLYRNAAIAGVRSRIDVQSADMCDMPLPSDSFDAAISTYAIDHMSREKSQQALSEVHRVLRPNGEFLLEVMHADAYTRIAFPMLAAHGYFGPMSSEAYWRGMLEEARFDVVDSGTKPATVYLLARKRP